MSLWRWQTVARQTEMSNTRVVGSACRNGPLASSSWQREQSEPRPWRQWRRRWWGFLREHQQVAGRPSGSGGGKAERGHFKVWLLTVCQTQRSCRSQLGVQMKSSAYGPWHTDKHTHTHRPSLTFSRPQSEGTLTEETSGNESLHVCVWVCTLLFLYQRGRERKYDS